MTHDPESKLDGDIPLESSGRLGRKNRFKVNQEIQEAFVNEIAEMMVSLGKDSGKWHAGWKQGVSSFPYCAATGKLYSGNNVLMLMLKAMASGYADPRWVTFNQMDALRKRDPEKLKDMHVRKGEKGATILRPEQAYFEINPETKKWRFLSAEEAQKIREWETQEEIEGPSRVHSTVLYYPFKVFNAQQIEGFPGLSTNEDPPTEVERNDFVEAFIASSGVEVHHGGNQPCFMEEANRVMIPLPGDFNSSGEYYAAKLHEFFHATGHESREKRLEKHHAFSRGGKEYAFEEIRAEIFSMMAGAHLGLPLDEGNAAAYISFWNGKFSGGEAKSVFNAAKDASKILTLLAQYEAAEQPSAKWFPKMKDWPDLLDAQKKRDAEAGVVFITEEESEGPTP